MDRTERLYKIDKLLRQHRRGVPTQKFLQELDVSRPTFHRDLEYLRDRFNAPIIHDRKAGGYHYDPASPNFELPGLWFTAAEAHALMTVQHLLREVQPGLLEPHLRPLQVRIEKLLEQGDSSLKEIQRRIRILQLAHRKVNPNYFELISHAVLARRRLHIHYYVRERDEMTRRDVSPQRLVHYRDNWYLDAYDHLHSGLRIFALDEVHHLKVLDKKARDIADKKLDEVLGSSYGIFAGKPTQQAVLHFNSFRAGWVKHEQWHPQQQSELQEDGSYILKIPYSDDRELLMDILKFGPDVEVLAPKNLRARVRECHREAAEKYE